MKKIIADMALFVLIGIALTIILSVANETLIVRPLYAPKKFKLDSNIQTLFCGASLAAFSFNPDVIPGSCNLGVPAENFFYTYYKLKNILEGNPQINTVVLTYAFASLCKKQDEDFNNPTQALDYYNRYFMLLDAEGRSVVQRMTRSYLYALMRWHLGFPIEMHHNLRLLGKAALNMLPFTEYPFWGGFQEKKIEQQAFFKVFKNDKEKGIKWALTRHFPLEGESSGASPTMITSLKKITRLCRDKNIRQILIVTPLQEDYCKLIPAYYKNLNTKTLTALKAINSDLEFYDYTQFITRDEYFLDCDHLNRTGASIFSEMIYETLLLKGSSRKQS